MSLHLFHSATFDQETFQAYVTNRGIQLLHRCRHIPGTQDTPIGYCTSIQQHPAHPPGPAEWQVVKYYDQPHIRLCCLSGSAINVLAREFGIPKGPDADEREASQLFFNSPAFLALIIWAKAHPRFAKQCQNSGPYLMNWYDRVHEDTTQSSRPATS